MKERGQSTSTAWRCREVHRLDVKSRGVRRRSRPELRERERIGYWDQALWTEPRVHGQVVAMARFVSNALFLGSLGFVLVTAAHAGDTYEPTYPPRILAVAPDASSFYLEFRAQHEVGWFGHSYVTLGTIDVSGEGHQTVIAGFLPRSADDDYWSKFGFSVRGLVGVTRSDLLRRPDTRFRIALSKAAYFRVVNEIRGLRRTWTHYELVVRNCNNFVGEIAGSVGLRTPLITAQYPGSYVAELRALNSSAIPRN